MKPEEPVMRHPDVIAQVVRLNARIRELEARAEKAEAELAALARLVVEDHRVGTLEYDRTQAMAKSLLSQPPGGRDSGAAVSAPSNGPPLATAAAKPPGLCAVCGEAGHWADYHGRG